MSSTDATVFSRASILSWANAALGARHSRLHDIPPTDAALILYSISCCRRQAHGAGASGGSGSGGWWPSSAVVSLQEMQFPASEGESVGGANGVAARLNAARFLSMARRVSEALVAGAGEEGASSSALPGSESGSGSGSNSSAAAAAAAATVVPDLSARADEWLAGTLFVEELQVWRWLRALAAGPDGQERVPVEEIRSGIRRFLGGAEAGTEEPAPRGALKRQRPGEEPAAEAEVKEDDDDYAVPGERSRPRARTESLQHSGGYPEAAPYSTSDAHAEVLRGAAAAAAATRSDNLRYHQQLSKAQAELQALAAERAAEEELLRRLQTEAGGAEDAQDGRVGEGKENSDGNGGHTCDVVAAYLKPRDALANAATAGCGDGAGANAGAGGGSSVPSAGGAAPPPPLACTACPSTFTYALQSNLLLIEKLEGARQQALAACHSRDPKKLLAALADFA